MQFENGDVLYLEKDGERLRFEVASYSYGTGGGFKFYDYVTVKPCDVIERRECLFFGNELSNTAH